MCDNIETLTPEQKVAQAIIEQATKGTFDISTTTPTTKDSVTESNTQLPTNHSNVNTTVVDKNVDQFLTS